MARAAVLMLSGLAAGCNSAGVPGPGGEDLGTAGEADVVVEVTAPHTSLDPDCEDVGDFTVHNAGYPDHDDGKCASIAGFTFDDAVAACGADVKYFTYSCSDFPAKRPYQPEPELAWTAYYGCCACTATSCSSPRVCYDDVCCTPSTCAEQGIQCGQAADGCGGILQCGGCADGNACVMGACSCNGLVCPPGDTCIMGQCSGCNPTTCPAPGVCEGEVCTSGCDPMTCVLPNFCLNDSECLLCSAPAVICGSACANLETDPNNCGACGNACPAGGLCAMGACTCDPMTCPSPNVCNAGSCVCPAPDTTCGSLCTNLQTDPSNCGTCGNACPAGDACAMGACGAGCNTVACPPPNVCSGNACVPSGGCQMGLTLCGMACTNLASDPSNCGECNFVCPGGACVMGACSSSSSSGVLLTPSSIGYVSDNAAGVVGSWYVYADGFGPDGQSADSVCVETGMFPAAACSVVTSPTPGAGSFPPNAMGAMCLTGTAAQVLDGPVGGPSAGMPDYADLFGEAIGLNLNDPAGDAGSPGFFDASNYTGISFDITFPSGTPQQNLRVQFPTSETVSTGYSAYWGGATAPGSPVVGGTNTFTWSEVGGPSYAPNPPPFDVTQIQAIQFAVYTDTAASVPVSFCISNLILTN